MKSKIILSAIAAAVLLSSCATSFGVQKRKYTKGYHVSVTRKNSVENKHEQTKNTVAFKQNETVKTEIVNAAPKVKTANTVEFAKVSTQTAKAQATTKMQEKLVVTASAKQKTVTTIKQAFKPVVVTKKQASKSSGGDANLVVMVILSLFPVLCLIAVWLHDGKSLTLNFWIDLLLHLTAIGEIIFALLVVLDVVNLDK